MNDYSNLSQNNPFEKPLLTNSASILVSCSDAQLRATALADFYAERAAEYDRLLDAVQVWAAQDFDEVYQVVPSDAEIQSWLNSEGYEFQVNAFIPTSYGRCYVGELLKAIWHVETDPDNVDATFPVFTYSGQLSEASVKNWCQAMIDDCVSAKAVASGLRSYSISDSVSDRLSYVTESLSSIFSSTSVQLNGAVQYIKELVSKIPTLKEAVSRLVNDTVVEVIDDSGFAISDNDLHTDFYQYSGASPSAVLDVNYGLLDDLSQLKKRAGNYLVYGTVKAVGWIGKQLSNLWDYVTGTVKKVYEDPHDITFDEESEGVPVSRQFAYGGETEWSSSTSSYQIPGFYSYFCRNQSLIVNEHVNMRLEETVVATSSDNALLAKARDAVIEKMGKGCVFSTIFGSYALQYHGPLELRVGWAGWDRTFCAGERIGRLADDVVLRPKVNGLSWDQGSLPEFASVSNLSVLYKPKIVNPNVVLSYFPMYGDYSDTITNFTTKLIQLGNDPDLYNFSGLSEGDLYRGLVFSLYLDCLLARWITVPVWAGNSNLFDHPDSIRQFWNASTTTTSTEPYFSDADRESKLLFHYDQTAIPMVTAHPLWKGSGAITNADWVRACSDFFEKGQKSVVNLGTIFDQTDSTSQINAFFKGGPYLMGSHLFQLFAMLQAERVAFPLEYGFVPYVSLPYASTYWEGCFDVKTDSENLENARKFTKSVLITLARIGFAVAAGVKFRALMVSRAQAREQIIAMYQRKLSLGESLSPSDWRKYRRAVKKGGITSLFNNASAGSVAAFTTDVDQSDAIRDVRRLIKSDS